MQIDGKTKVIGIFGWPVEHTLSPAIHNVAFEIMGLNYVYVPFPVNPLFLYNAVFGAKALGLAGLNITIPHKQAIIEHLDEITKLSREVGAVNTVEFRDDKIIGHNTDGIGFLQSLEMDGGIEPKDKNVLLIGAGGAARAVAFTCAENHANSIAIMNRNQQNAESLKTNIHQFYPKIEVTTWKLNDPKIDHLMGDFDIVINSTSLGMKSYDPIPLHPEWLNSKMIVMDLIYCPLETEFLKSAKKVGCRTVNGIGMLLYQGVAAFEIWTGVKPDIEVMKSALEKTISQ